MILDPLEAQILTCQVWQSKVSNDNARCLLVSLRRATLRGWARIRSMWPSGCRGVDPASGPRTPPLGGPYKWTQRTSQSMTIQYIQVVPEHPNLLTLICPINSFQSVGQYDREFFFAHQQTYSKFGIRFEFTVNGEIKWQKAHHGYPLQACIEGFVFDSFSHRSLFLCPQRHVITINLSSYASESDPIEKLKNWFAEGLWQLGRTNQE